jgi:hypothetical protein
MPAQMPDKQINVPIFRMLGSDPIYQYDASLGDNGQGVFTLEPSFSHAGGNPDWVRWFFRQMEQNPSLSFAYAQVGQENNFGWDRIKNGYIDQIKYLKRIADKKNIRIEKLCDSAAWFRRTFPITPPSSTIAMEDWQQKGNSSIWYNCKNYRANLIIHDDEWRLRDIHLFDENYHEPYLKDSATTDAIAYDTLPIMDGFLWSAKNSPAGVTISDRDGQPLRITGISTVHKIDGEILKVTSPLIDGKTFDLTLFEDRMEFCIPESTDYRLCFNWPANPDKPVLNGDCVNYIHHDYRYAIRFINGETEFKDGHLLVSPLGKTPIVMSFSHG